MTAFATVFGGLAANGIAWVAVYHVQIARAKKHLVVRNEAEKRRDSFLATKPQNWAKNLRHEQEQERKNEDELDGLRERVEMLNFQLDLASRKGAQGYRPGRSGMDGQTHSGSHGRSRPYSDDDGPGAGHSAHQDEGEDEGPGAGAWAAGGTGDDEGPGAGR